MPHTQRVRPYRRLLPYQFLGVLGKRTISDIRLGDHVERDLTILFSDIRGFTSLSEALTPDESFEFINAYFRAMEPALFEANGVIDKYIGDAIMALFPTGADDAVRGAVGMLGRLRAFNARRRRRGAPPVRIGIGLNTGPSTAGAVGGRRRMETTVISDAVNLASRVEALTKVYGVPLLVSEHVVYSLTDPAAHDLRFVDRVRIRGKEQPQSVYEVFDGDPPSLRAAKRRTKPLFEEALAHYHFRDVRAARRLLRRCLALCPGDAAAQAYLARCARVLRGGAHEGTGETALTVRWSPSLRVGDDLIDLQHRALFARVNRFAKALQGARTAAEVEGMSAFLRAYVQEHFDAEERCMRRERYPLLAMQQRAHARFARDFELLDRQLRQRLPTQRVFLLFKVQLLVVDWVVTHTAKLDRHFGRYLAGRRHRRAARGGRR